MKKAVLEDISIVMLVSNMAPWEGQGVVVGLNNGGFKTRGHCRCLFVAEFAGLGLLGSLGRSHTPELGPSTSSALREPMKP